MVFTQRRFEESNATVQWTVAGDGLTEPNLYFAIGKMQTNLLKSTNTKNNLLLFLSLRQKSNRFLTPPSSEGGFPLRRDYCIAKALGNHRHRWFSLYNKIPGEFGKEFLRDLL